MMLIWPVNTLEAQFAEESARAAYDLRMEGEILYAAAMLEKLQMQGITLVMIEHRLRALFRLADRVLVMNFGEKIAEGTPQQIMDDEKVREAYLGSDKLSWD